MQVRSNKECWLRMAEYRLTLAAENDLELIWNYTVKLWGTGQADRYTDSLTAAFAELAQSQGSPLHVTTSGLAIAATVLSGT